MYRGRGDGIMLYLNVVLQVPNGFIIRIVIIIITSVTNDGK